MRAVLAGGAALLLSACSTLDYYAHLARGQIALLSAREPIETLIARPTTDDKLRAKLKLALEARAYASDVLGLPRNGSYTRYADLGRPWVLRNLFATPEFSVEAIEHCFPIAGCVAYRGYYDELRLTAEAERLKTEGDDVYVGDVPAYSTLGWFDDPLLNTMLGWDDEALVGTLFHELAHQQLYLKGDTQFNESFASFVEQQGLRQWRQTRGQARHQAPGQSEANAERGKRADQFAALILATRERLKTLYASGLPAAGMRAAKQAEFERLRADYRVLRDTQWQGYAGYDGWINAELNNARLLPFGLYHQWLPGFARLFGDNGGDWPRFYAAAKALADGDAEQRAARLESSNPNDTAASP